MPHSKPFYRNVRGMIPGPHAGYSGWSYIKDPEYAESPAHYTRGLLLILDDLKSIFEYVEPSDEGMSAFSYRIHSLLMRTCIEIEANFKAILDANEFSIPPSHRLTIRDFRRIDATHHLSSYEVILPIWNGVSPTIKPFEAWRRFRGIAAPDGAPLSWYQAYNASKHNRQSAFKKANLSTLIHAVAGLLVIVSAQFKDITFDGKADNLTLESGPFKPSIGEVFLIKYPDDWSEKESYDFDWSKLKSQADRFNKIDYNAIPI